MRCAIVAVLAMASVAASPRGDAPDEESRKLQGTWILVAEEVAGKTSPAEEVEGGSRTVRGDRVVRKAVATTSKAILRLDPTTEPKRYDAEIIEGPARGRVIHGIYRFEGDRLKTCADTTGLSRPKTFATTHKDHYSLQVWRRKD